MSQFWMVHGTGPCNFRHTTRQAAEREADRLARANPGTMFFVTEAISAHVKHDVERIDLRRGDARVPPDRMQSIGDYDDWSGDIPF